MFFKDIYSHCKNDKFSNFVCFGTVVNENIQNQEECHFKQ